MSKPNNAVRGEIQHTIYCRHSVKPEARSFSDKFISSIRHPAESLHLLLSTEQTFCQMHLLGPAVRSNQTITTSLNMRLGRNISTTGGPEGAAREGAVIALFFIVYGSWCSPVAWPGSSHRMEVARGPGNTKTKTLNLLKEFMGQTIPNSAPLLWDSFYIFSLNFGDCC